MHSYVRAALVPKALKQFVIKRSNNLLCPKANSMALLAYKDATALGILFETGMKKGEAISTLWPLLFYGFLIVNPEINEQYDEPCKVVNGTTDKSVLKFWSYFRTVTYINDGTVSRGSQRN